MLLAGTQIVSKVAKSHNDMFMQVSTLAPNNTSCTAWIIDSSNP